MVVEGWLNGKNMVPLTHQKGDFNIVERGNPGKRGEWTDSGTHTKTCYYKPTPFFGKISFGVSNLSQ
jgi:hypothetical protein